MSEPLHTVLCLRGPCPHDCPAALAEDGPREPDLTEPCPGQGDLLELLGTS